jgi:hypothetical protein
MVCLGTFYLHFYSGGLSSEIRRPGRDSDSDCSSLSVFTTQRKLLMSQFQWPSDLRRESTAYRLLGLRVRIQPVAYISVSCECCVLSGRDLCDGPIPHPEESYRLWCFIMYDLEPSRMRRPWPALGYCVRQTNF